MFLWVRIFQVSSLSLHQNHLRNIKCDKTTTVLLGSLQATVYFQIYISPFCCVTSFFGHPGFGPGFEF